MPTLTVNPNPAPTGYTVSASGTGYVPKARHRLMFAGSVKATFRTTRTGAFGPIGVVMPSILVTAPMTVQQYISGQWKAVGLPVTVATYFALPEPPPPPPVTPTDRLTDLPGWRLALATDFSGGPGLPAGFGAYPTNYRDTYEQGHPGKGMYYDPARMTVHDGRLDMHVGWVDGVKRGAALVPQYRGPSIRVAWLGFQADVIPGIKTAPLTWPDSGLWPDEAEADHPETNLDGGDVDSFWHYAQKAGIEPHQDWFGWPGIRLTDKHDYYIVKTPTYVEFGVDDLPPKRTTKYMTTASHHPVCQVETRLDGQLPPAGANGHVYMEGCGVWVPA